MGRGGRAGRAASGAGVGQPDVVALQLSGASSAVRRASCRRCASRSSSSSTGTISIVALGAPVFTYHIEGFGPHIPPGASLVQIIDDPNVAAWTPLGTALVCNVRLGVQAILEKGRPEGRPLPSSEGSSRSRPAPRGRTAPPRVTADAGLTIAFLMQTLADVRPADSIIVEESPSSRKTMQAHLPIERPQSFFTCASGGLGHSLPAAVGIALAKSRESARDRDLRRRLGDVLDSRRCGRPPTSELPMTIVIVNNGGYAALSEFTAHFNIKQLIGTKLPGLDFVGLANAMGCAGARVERAYELASALQGALQSTKPFLARRSCFRLDGRPRLTFRVHFSVLFVRACSGVGSGVRRTTNAGTSNPEPNMNTNREPRT